MLNKLLEIGTVFDWISPLLAELQDITNGPSHTFLIPEDCGWSGREIEQLLRQHGVKTWGLMIIDQMIMITTRLTQARWAQYLLSRERIPIEYGLIDERAAHTNHPTRENNTMSLLETLDRWLNELENLLGFYLSK